MHSNGGFYVTNDVIHRSGIVTAFMTTSATFDAARLLMIRAVHYNTAPMDDVIGDVKASVAMHRIEEELSELISKTETIIENKENSSNFLRFSYGIIS
jgi:hypothetical protein